MYLNLEIEKAPGYLKKAVEENRQRFADLMEQRNKATDKEDILSLSNQIRELINKDRSDNLNINLSYIRSFESNPAGILEDVADILKALEKPDFLKWLANGLELLREQQEEEAGADPKEAPEEQKDAFYYKDAKEDYKSAVVFLQDTLYLQLEALNRWNNEGLKTLQQMAEEKAAEWYEREKLPEEIREHKYIYKYMPVKYIDHPIDRPNNIIWNSLETTETDGQITFSKTVVTGKGLRDEEINVLVAVSWNQPGAKITTTLNSFDKRIYIACAALLKAGNTTFSISEIYKVLTGKDKPSLNQRQKIENSLTKMGTARLYLNNIAELEAGYNYPPVGPYDEPLLAFRRISNCVVNGQLTTMIQLLCEPKLIQFARERNQITSYKKELLHVPLNYTEENLRLQDYLLSTISAEKNKKLYFFEILFKTIKESCSITSRSIGRLTNKLDSILKHYENNDFIKAYEIKEDRIKISL